MWAPVSREENESINAGVNIYIYNPNLQWMHGHKISQYSQPTRYNVSPSLQCFQPRLAFSPFWVHTNLSPSQVTRLYKATRNSQK